MAAIDELSPVWVDVGTLKIGLQQDELRTVVGSCVAVILYDPQKQVGGLLHAMLPERPAVGRPLQKTQYAREGTELLLDAMRSRGCQMNDLRATIVGGGVLSGESDTVVDLARGNLQAAVTVLQGHGVIPDQTHAGGACGRTLSLEIPTGQLSVRELNDDEGDPSLLMAATHLRGDCNDA